MSDTICHISAFDTRARTLQSPSTTAGCLMATFRRSSSNWFRQAWIEIHKDELAADWELAIAGEEPFRIAPLQ